MLIVLLPFVIFVGFDIGDAARNFVTEFNTQTFQVPENFTQCVPRWDKIVPYRLNSNKWSVTTITTSMLMIQNYLRKNCPENLTHDDIRRKMFFNVYYRNNTHKVVPGALFFANTNVYANLTDPHVTFIMAGFMTDCGIDPDKVSNTYDWRTHCVRGLLENRDSLTIVINWGKLACYYYPSIIAHLMAPIGIVLGVLFRQFEPDNLHLISQSLTPQFMARAANYVREFSHKKVREFIALDIGGILITRNDTFGKFPNTFTTNLNRVSRDTAQRVIIFYTNPHGFGIGVVENYDVGHLNIKINEGRTAFLQPGRPNGNGATPNAYDHGFAPLVFTAFCEGRRCRSRGGPSRGGATRTYLNFFRADTVVEDGTYDMDAELSYPFCCDPEEDTLTRVSSSIARPTSTIT